MADMLTGFTEGLNGFLGGTGSIFVQLLIAIQLPLLIVWLLLTASVIWVFFFRRTVIVNPYWPIAAVTSKIPFMKNAIPSPWKYKVTLIRPFATLKTDISQDIGALVSEDGILRFKLKSENVIMQKPNTTDVYPNGEILITSLGPMTKLMCRREIDYLKKKIYIELENSQIASLYAADIVEANDPDWLLNKFREVSMMIILWVITTCLFVGSNLLTFYPFIYRAVLWG